ncbi:hypothetical protein [Methylobacillus sp.]|uniref:hypothetical protein n=1 Tax=Methylobacillus sp. TaxID=56818 RepID=UPI0012CDD6C8|nr:hypothetical protein [Methylobacillus sp.]MPS48508.1 hypothetical protein [Methylobacillus sp.]
MTKLYIFAAMHEVLAELYPEFADTSEWRIITTANELKGLSEIPTNLFDRVIDGAERGDDREEILKEALEEVYTIEPARHYIIVLVSKINASGEWVDTSKRHLCMIPRARL